MPASDHIRSLRRHVGHELLLLPGVAALVRDGEGRLLFCRAAEDGRWSLPAGAVDPGEPPARAIVREVWEETGLRVVPERIRGVFGGELFRTTYVNGDQCEYVVTLFECRVVGGELTPRDGEHAELRWCAPDDLPPLPPRYPQLLAAGQGGEAACFQWDETWLEAIVEG